MPKRLLDALSVHLYQDEDQARMAGLLNVIIIASFVIALLSFLSWPFLHPVRLSGLVMYLAVLAAHGGLFFSLRAGYLQFTRIALCCGFWLAITNAVVTSSSGLNDPTFIFYTGLIVVNGLILGTRSAAAFSLLTALLYLPYALHGSIIIWVNSVLVFAIVTLLIALARRNIKESLGRARQSEMRYRVVSELISDYAFCLRFEPDGSAVSEWFTPGSFLRLTGYSVEEIISTTKLYHPDEVQTVLRDLDDVKQGKTTDSEYRIVTKSGEPRWLHMTRYPLWDEAHTRVVCYYGVAQDITRRKQAEEQQREMAAAVEQERAHMLRRFLSDASHDLATPLAVLNTSLYLLRKVTEPEQQTRHIDQLGKQIDRIRLILDDMFTLMHLDMADQEFACSVQPLNTLVEEVVQLQQPSAANRQLRLTLMLDGQNLAVCADREALSSAMQHVLTNALNFTPEGGCISVRTYSRDQAAFVEVSDTGVGISAENLPRIFDRFYRVDQARGSTNGGSGLGLTIVRKILQAHHGDVEVESVWGKGSTFRLWLPLSATASASASAVSEANAAVIPASPPTSEAINPVNQGTIEIT